VKELFLAVFKNQVTAKRSTSIAEQLFGGAWYGNLGEFTLPLTSKFLKM